MTVDSNDYLYLDSDMEVEFDFYEEIDEIEVDGYADQDGQDIGASYADGDDYTPASFELYSYDPVATGHEYGMESDGYACFDDAYDDDGYGDCEWDYIGYIYASLNLYAPPPRIYGISPPSVNVGDTGTLTLTGADFIENSTDQLTLNFSGSGNPFTPTGTPTATTATYSYDFTGYAPGTYTLSVTNNEASSDNTFFTVLPIQPTLAPPVNACAIGSDPKVGYTSIVSTGAPRGSGTMAVSFSGAALRMASQAVAYGPYSTPSSIAANIAALMTKNYARYGLTARAFGSYIVYSGNSALGTVNYSTTGSSITTTASPTAETGAEMACESAPPIPPVACGIPNLQYVLAVTNDSVTWIDVGINYGRNVNYSLEYLPTSPNKLGAPVTGGTVTEHLTNAMAYGNSSVGNPNTGEFDDFLGNNSGINSGTYTTDRCFTVTLSGQSLGHVMSYDAAGKHSSDHIQIKLPKGPSILNGWTNPDGSPKDISIP